MASNEVLQEVEAGLKMKWKRYYGVYDGTSQIEIFDSNGDKKLITLDVNIENLKWDSFSWVLVYQKGGRPRLKKATDKNLFLLVRG